MTRMGTDDFDDDLSADSLNRSHLLNARLVYCLADQFSLLSFCNSFLIEAPNFSMIS